MTIHPIHAWILAFLVLHPLGCAGCEAPAPGKLGGAPAAPAASPAPARVATARTDILDAHVRMSTAEISTMIQAMADNGLDRVINLDGGNLIEDDIPGLSFRGGYIGFSGSTGWATNWHRIDNLTVVQACE